jgi:hypothetical protein
VTNLYAATNATLGGKDTATVAVIDNTTEAILLSCTVEKPNSSCSNTGASVAVVPGQKIEVKIMASGSSGNNKQWQVTFRY